jgi:hypothetical protein
MPLLLDVLMVKSHFDGLTLNFQIAKISHNLCFIFSNGEHDPTLIM